LAKAVFDKPTVGELIAVRALEFRRDWRRFLELISPDDTRTKFLTEYKQLKKAGKTISNEELDKLIKESSETEPLSKDIVQIYRELLKQGLTLRRFLDVGAADILLHIKELEGLRRALDTVQPTIDGTKEQLLSTDDLLELLRDGKVEQFNGIVSKPDFRSVSLDFAGAYLPGADLSRANLSHANLLYADLSHANLLYANLSHAPLSGANLSRAKLSYANLSRADLSGAVLSGANLSHVVLSGANLSHANLSYAVISNADLSRADLSNANLRGCKEFRPLICTDAIFNNAIIDDELSNYLRNNKAKNVPK
jgi:hypothetical protein